MLILPAIDLRGGKCVRLFQGDYERETAYSEDPVAVAMAFEAQGAQWLHVVDLDGARGGTSHHLSILAHLREQTGLRIEFGGGIRTQESAHSALDSGADRVIIGSALVNDPEGAARMLAELGERAVAMIDGRAGKVATEGWTDAPGPSIVSLVRWVCEAGARRIAVTDIERDGTLKGPNLELLGEVLQASRVPVIASGGVSSLADLQALATLPITNLEGVIVGKALYEGRFTLSQAIEMLG